MCKRDLYISLLWLIITFLSNWSSIINRQNQMKSQNGHSIKKQFHAYISCFIIIRITRCIVVMKCFLSFISYLDWTFSLPCYDYVIITKYFFLRYFQHGILYNSFPVLWKILYSWNFRLLRISSTVPHVQFIAHVALKFQLFRDLINSVFSLVIKIRYDPDLVYYI